MKKSTTTFILLLFAILSFSQSQAIKNLEATTAKLSGEDYVKNALTLADWLYNEGFYEKSVDWADKAGDAAKKLKDNNLVATCLNQRGKSQIKVPSKRDNLKNKAFKNFEESNSLTTDAELKLDNLQHLKELATDLGKKKDLEKIDREIAVLTAGDANRKKAQEELQQAKAQNEQLSSEVSNIAEEKEKLANQRQNLQKMVAAKEAAIQNMSAAQVKQQLLFSEQSRMLDSMQFAGAMDSMELAQKDLVVQQQQSELQQKQAEIELQSSQRNLLLAIVALVVLLGGGLFFRYQTISKHNAVLSEKNRIIEEERKRSEELLLNILPASIAEELKKNGAAEARRFDNATVLFTDFQGFSAISKQLSAEKLVDDLDYAFRNFDRIIGKYGLEKIKTIGDAYMCAGGIPDYEGHPKDVVKAGLEIQQFLKDWNKEKRKRGEPPFEARIGIHTGPIVAGVVGSRKFAYDIWGDTVNVASRMETSGQPGLVNISASTFAFVKEDFKCEYRGKVPAKNVGEVEMYFVLN
jgi:class 3 adenylate cyclase